MASSRDIQTLRCAFLVGKRKPVSELPRFWRWLARKVYFHTGWASDYGIESQAVCTTRELAEELCRDRPEWFIQELPINATLPDETCKFKLMTFPASEMATTYENGRRAPYLAVPSSGLSDLIGVENKVEALEHSIEGIRAKAS